MVLERWWEDQGSSSSIYPGEKSLPFECHKIVLNSALISVVIYFIFLYVIRQIFLGESWRTLRSSLTLFCLRDHAPYFLADVHALCSFVLSFINLRYHFSYFPLSASLSPSWFFRWVLISGIIGCSFIINSNITSSNISFYLFATLSSLLQNYFLRLSIFVKCRISLSLEERRK